MIILTRSTHPPTHLHCSPADVVRISEPTKFIIILKYIAKATTSDSFYGNGEGMFSYKNFFSRR